MTSNTTRKLRRSVALKPAQLESLKGKVARSETKLEAALSLGVSHYVLDRILQYGSCSEKTYKKLFPEEDED